MTSEDAMRSYATNIFRTATAALLSLQLSGAALAQQQGQFSNCGRGVNPVLYLAPVRLMSVVGAQHIAWVGESRDVV
jgi:hypothetical protein